jgi:hypothetical protein
MRLPEYLTKYSGPSSSGEASSSVDYDHSGADELVKRNDEISKLQIAKNQALYTDPLSAMSHGRRIADLVRMMGSIEPVRISRMSNSSGGRVEGASFEAGNLMPKKYRQPKEEEEGDD